MPETPLQPATPDLNIWDPTPHANPDPEVIDALMTAVQAQNSDFSDQSRRNDGTPDSVTLVSLTKNSNRFVPPKRLVPEDRRNNFQGQQFLSDVADRVLFKAQRDAFGNEAVATYMTQRSNPSSITNIFRGFTVINNNEGLWLTIDTAATDRSSAEISAEVTMLVNNIRARYRTAVEAVMQDAAAMSEIQRVVEVRQAVQAGVVLKGEIEYLNHVREQVENPKDQEAFVQTLNKAVQALGGYNGVRVELLPTEKALVWGAQGLYSSTGEQALVSVPMSKYGTDQLLEMDDILKILAHELSHHSTLEHGLTHTLNAGQILQRLRAYDGWTNLPTANQSKAPAPTANDASPKLPWWKFSRK